MFMTSSMPQPGEITPAHDVDTLNAMAAMQGWDKWQGSGQGMVARAPLQQQNSCCHVLHIVEDLFLAESHYQPFRLLAGKLLWQSFGFGLAKHTV